jgi:hypothetical protein
MFHETQSKITEMFHTHKCVYIPVSEQSAPWWWWGYGMDGEYNCILMMTT